MNLVRPIGLALAGIALVGVGTAIGVSAGHTTVTNTVTRTVTKDVPGPVTTKTVTVTKDVPGPVKYKTVYVPASQGPTGTTIAQYSGSGNQNTGTFNAPASGDYVVKWSYSANVDSSGLAANFIMSNTDQTAESMGLPNDINSSGSGSTEVTGASGPESFNVQASGSWAVTVISAP